MAGDEDNPIATGFGLVVGACFGLLALIGCCGLPLVGLVKVAKLVWDL